MLEIFIKNAEEQIHNAMGCAMKVESSKNKTEILNAEYHMAQFHAYMDMIEIVDFEKYVEIGEKTRCMTQFVLEAIDKLYR